MRAMFGVVSLLVALAIVGLLAVKQLRAVGQVGSAPTAGSPAGPQMSGSGPVRAQVQGLQKQVTDDVAKAMGQAASARRDDSGKQ